MILPALAAGFQWHSVEVLGQSLVHLRVDKLAHLVLQWWIIINSLGGSRGMLVQIGADFAFMGGVLLECCTEHSCLIQGLLLLNGCLVQAIAVEHDITVDLW